MNVAFLAYGQTGAGETFTMIGNDNHPGIIPRTIQSVLQLGNSHSDESDIVVSYSIMEIYKDHMIDLQLRESKEQSEVS